MVAEASGCCASDVSAVATAFPSASAGIMQPMLVANAAQMIDTIPIIAILSMSCPLLSFVGECAASRSCSSLFVDLVLDILFAFPRLCGRRDVDGGEDAENVGLHHSGQ